MNNITKSLGDFIPDRTESLDDELIHEYFIDRNDDKIARLLDSEQYILEGGRGTGKTMLMKYAALTARKNFGNQSILAVWVSFEESIRIERIKMNPYSDLDPFLQWTMGKILYEVLTVIVSLKPSSMERLSERLTGIFQSKSSGNYDIYVALLKQYIIMLEKADVEDSVTLKSEAPSIELTSILDNPTSFKAFLLELIQDFELKRIVLLFDEAAHMFSHSQQAKFFTFFKALRDPKIACKAAVYPGITNYGKYFDRGQDAKELRLEWMPNNKDDVQFIRKILKKRIQGYSNEYWNSLTRNPRILDTICISSNGNPRFAFHIIDELENANAFQRASIPEQTVIRVLRSVIDTKWKEFDTLKVRLVKYSKFITIAERFVKDVIIPNLRDWNTKQKRASKLLSMGFYIETSVYEQVPYLFDVLSYSNILSVDYKKKSIGHSLYGYYMCLNPSFLFSELLIKDSSEIARISVAIENNQAYYQTSPDIVRVTGDGTFDNEYECTNCDFRTSNETYKFCPQCGNPIKLHEEEPLYKILRGHSIDNLRLSDKIIVRLKQRFSNIGEIYDSDPDDIRMSYIQDVRIEKIKTAVIEYMAG